jgi:hypothetical protein
LRYRLLYPIATNPATPIPSAQTEEKLQLVTLSFLEGGLRLEQGRDGDEGNIFAQVAKRRP